MMSSISVCDRYKFDRVSLLNIQRGNATRFDVAIVGMSTEYENSKMFLIQAINPFFGVESEPVSE
jgi:hypothetical protein